MAGRAAKTMVTTSGIDGVGANLVKHLLGKPEPHRIIMGGHGTEDGQPLTAGPPHSLTVAPVRLGNLRSVKSFAQQALDNIGPSKLDYLFLKAGIKREARGRPNPSAPKWCRPYVVNHLSQHYLTHLLREKLVASKTRIVIYSSTAISNVSDPSRLEEDLVAGSGKHPKTLFAASKFAQLLAAHWWRRQLQGACDVVVVAPTEPKQSEEVNQQELLRAFTRNDFPEDADRIVVSGNGWWPRSMLEKTLDKDLQDKWCPSIEEIEREQTEKEETGDAA